MVDLEAKCNKMEFEETELRLGLNYGKRGYDEMVDLKLNLSSSTNMVKSDDHEDHHEAAKNLEKAKNSVDSAKPPPPKAQVVGWPPVRSFRKNITMTAVPKTSGGSTEESGGGAAFVKVSMDGAPYLRKVDLSMYKTYSELSHALTKMFSSFTASITSSCAAANLQCGLEGKENSQVDHVPTYQDKDGDWMLVGDVPWEMFVESCKRLRIMKGAEAKGLAPRAMEKCKTRS